MISGIELLNGFLVHYKWECPFLPLSETARSQKTYFFHSFSLQSLKKHIFFILRWCKVLKNMIFSFCTRAKSRKTCFFHFVRAQSLKNSVFMILHGQKVSKTTLLQPWDTKKSLKKRFRGFPGEKNDHYPVSAAKKRIQKIKMIKEE